jgi:hypothetical protein
MTKEQYNHLKYLVINNGYCNVGRTECFQIRCLVDKGENCFPKEAYKRALKILKINSLLKLF